MRLFVAVSPPAPVVDALEAFPRTNVASVRWTTAEQWHVTLRFLGEVTRAGAVVDSLQQGLPRTASGDATGDVHAALGPASAWFPGRHVLQVPVQGLDRLAGAVVEATAQWGDRRTASPFRGHLTLARSRGNAPGPAHLAGIALSATWPVWEIALFSSTLGPGGAQYDPLAIFPVT